MRRVVRFTGYAGAVAIALACMLLLALRFLVLPNVESQRAAIAAWIAGELKHPVEIDAILTGWDGWNPEIVVQGLRVRDAAGAAGTTLIDLPSVTGVISWTSLVLADLRLKELTIDRPRLAIRRDTSGRLHVAGLEIDPGAVSQDTSLSDWVLRQRLIVVRGALVSWNDDLRNAPQLLLDRVDVRLENRFGHHRFGLTGTPPPEVAAPIDLRGDLVADIARRLAAGPRARLRAARLRGHGGVVRMAAVADRDRERRGRAARAGSTPRQGVPATVVADVELADVRTRLARDLPPLDLAHLAGRVTWVQDGDQRSLSGRGLTLDGKGVTIAPTDFHVRFSTQSDGAVGPGSSP